MLAVLLATLMPAQAATPASSFEPLAVASARERSEFMGPSPGATGSRADAKPPSTAPASGSTLAPGSASAPPKAPATASTPGSASAQPAAPDQAAPAAEDRQSAADKKLEAHLRRAAGGEEGRTDCCLGLAWNVNEPDAELRAAALRRLQNTDARIVAEALMHLIEDAPASAQVGMLDLMAEKFPALGGMHSSLNEALAGRIRSSDTEVARKAIEVCTSLGIPQAYLPLREIASRPAANLRAEAILGIARLRDPRAVDLFRKLLENGEVPHEDVYRALAQVGRPSALFLKTRLDDSDSRERGLALDALLDIATVDDLSALYAYLEKHPPEGDIKARIYDTIATIQSKNSAKPLGGKDP